MTNPLSDAKERAVFEAIRAALRIGAFKETNLATIEYTYNPAFKALDELEARAAVEPPCVSPSSNKNNSVSEDGANDTQTAGTEHRSDDELHGICPYCKHHIKTRDASTGNTEDVKGMSCECGKGRIGDGHSCYLEALDKQKASHPATDTPINEAISKAVIEWAFCYCQPDKGDVFGWLDDQKEALSEYIAKAIAPFNKPLSRDEGECDVR